MSQVEDLHIAKPGSFYGVYILYNINVKFKGQIYIGFTVNPGRRIRQHNREIKGGAKQTGRNNKGPWDMVLITHGFRTRLAALQFEWAWQHPSVSRRLSHLPKKTRKESLFSYRLRILSEMLNAGPWNRLSLTIQWLKQEYIQQFPLEKPPPFHMPIAYGEIKTMKISKKKSKDTEEKHNEKDPLPSSDDNLEDKKCDICQKENNTGETMLSCILSNCQHKAHKTCLAQHFLSQSNESNEFLLPVSGQCPSCDHDLLWSDLVKQTVHHFEDTEDDNAEQSDSEDDEFQ